MRRLLLFLLAALLPAAAQAAGCGRPLAPGSLNLPLTVDGRDRPFTLHVPAGYDPARPAPLLLDLHGSGGTGAGQARVSGLAAAAARRGVVVVAPDGGIAAGEGFVWNIPGVPTVAGSIPGPTEADDVRYLLAVIDAAAAAMCIDPARVYATGLSGGGRMASWLACVAADRIAAIAPVVGLRAGRARADDETAVDPATCRPSRTVPVITFAGARDRTNPLAGGEGRRWGYPMAAALRRWAAINGCTRAEPTRWLDPRHYRQRYAGCRPGGAVEAIVDVEGAHEWAVADDEAMLAFLLRHRRGR